MSTPTATRPESRLVLRAQSGDRSALDDLLRLTQAWLIRFLTRMVRKRHDAEDILQDVSIQIYRKLKYLNEHHPAVTGPQPLQAANQRAVALSCALDHRVESGSKDPQG